MWFPKRGPLGNCVPEWALRVGCSFRKEVLGETVPRSDPKYWDTISVKTEEGALPAVDADNAPFG